MKKTKKALLAALACSAVLAGSFGLTACGNKDDGDEGHSHSWSDWTVATQPTATKKGKATRECNGNGTCDAAAADKEYNDLPFLGSSDYEKGADTATCTTAGTQHYTYNKNGVEVEFDVDTPVNANAHSYAEGVYVDIDPDGHYQVCEHNEAHTTTKADHDELGANGVCSVCGYDKNHVHVFDTNTWDKDASGHWHPTTCGHKIKTEGFAAHEYGEWTETKPASVTEEGLETSTCTVEGCGYVGTRAIPKLPQSVEGGEDYETAVTITAGRYSVVLDGIEGPYGYAYSQYFKIVCGEEAKKYTLTVTSDVGALNSYLYEPFDVVLEAGESYVFTVDGDEVGDEVVFTIEEGEAPAPGAAVRPITVKEAGHYGKADADEDERVYIRLDHNVLGGANVSFTLGAGVQLYSIIEDNLTDGGAGDEVTVGTTIEVGDWNDVFLYIVGRGGDCFVDFTVNYEEGTKRNPLAAGIGDENANTVEDDTWFKLETAGKYVIKCSAEATVEIYADVNDEMPVDYTYSGSSLLVNVSAGTPVYIKAYGVWGSTYTLTVKEYTDADKGTVASEPITLTPSDTVTLGGGTRYYTYTAAKTGMVTFSFDDGENSVHFWHYSDASFNQFGATSGVNKLSVSVTEGETYYFQTVNYDNVTGTFEFTAAEFGAHSYVITLTNGETNEALGLSDVTVKLYEKGDSETVVKTGTTVNGVVTFDDVDGSKDYKLVIENLPNAYGYYDFEMNVAKNIDETTNFAALVYEKQPYTVTIALPEGAEELDLSGVKVILQNVHKESERYELTTEEQGAVTLTVLDPKFVSTWGGVEEFQDSGFKVTIEIPETSALYGKYVHKTVQYQDVTLSKGSREVEVTLTAIVTYELTLTDGTNPIAGVSVTVNGKTETTDAEGKVSISTYAGEYEIIVGGNYVTSTKTSATQLNITVVCEQTNAPVSGGDDKSSAVALTEGTTPYSGASWYATYGEFTSEEGGTYVITLAGMGFGICEAYFNGNQVLQYVYDEATETGSYVGSGVVTDVAKGENDIFPTSITVTLQAGESIVIGTYNSGMFTITEQ